MTRERADSGGAAAVVVLAGLALATIGLVVWLALAGSDDRVIEPGPRSRTSNAASIDGDRAPANPGSDGTPTRATTAIQGRDAAGLDPELANADAPQGVSGRLLRPDGTPAARAHVELVASTLTDGSTVAATTTAPDGTFALGVDRPGQPVRLAARCQDLPPLRAGPFRPRPATWLHTGDLRFPVAIAVHGRVIDRATGTAIAGAEVAMTDHEPLRATGTASPARTTTVTDATGAFRFEAARSGAEHDFTATAPGYARATLGPHRMPAAGTAAITFELERGAELRGIVADPTGRPVGGVELELTPVAEAGSASPGTATAVTVTSGRDGTFAVDTLRPGSYRVAASGGGYRTTASTTARTGPGLLRVRVVPEPWLRLRVLGADGQPLRRFRLELRNVTGSTLRHSLRLAGSGPRTIGPADHGSDGWAALRGVPAGRFRCAIMAPDHAPTVTEPFAVVPGGTAAAAELTVRLDRGGSIAGTVVDAAGRPIPAAVVRAVPADLAPAESAPGEPEPRESAPGEAGPAPRFGPEPRTLTNAAGRFRLDLLPLHDYVLIVRHPDHSEARTTASLGAARPSRDLGDVLLPRGAAVAGRITVDGKPGGRARVVLTGRRDSGRSGEPEGAAEARPAVATAFSGPDGRYEFPRRLPPGEYRIHVQRLNGSSNPDRALFDIRESQRPITIPPTRERMTFDFQLPAR